jgi:transcriptional regulator GlxA family with amidase domain
MSARTEHEIGIVDYPGAQVACILGLTDMFGVASTVTLDQWRFGLSQLRVTHWRPRHSRDANLSCVYDSAPHGSPKPRTLIIPPTLVDPNPDVPAGVVTWVRNLHAAGSSLVSLCTGAFILAQTGLVDGRSVATHQICAESLAKRFPRIVVDVNRRIIDYGDIVTAADFSHGSTWACFSLRGFLAGPRERRRRDLFFPMQRVRRAILRALLLLKSTEIKPC